MTITEFLDPLSRQSDIVLATLYYREKVEGAETSTVSDIRGHIRDARIPNWRHMNIARALSGSGAHAHVAGANGRQRQWQLTRSGTKYIEETLGLSLDAPEAVNNVESLRKLIDATGNDAVKAYLKEALDCLEVDAQRACVVFVWSAVVSTLRDRMMVKGSTAVSAALQKHDKKARQIRSIDDFAYIKDSLLLLGAKELGLLDKSEKDTLEENLNLRNKCGHPGKYRPGVQKVSAFLEDVTSIVFT